MELAHHKIKNWCAYQERSQNETRQKLLSLGLHSEETEEIIAELIQENFLNEQRFASALANGKLRIKHWGKNKIKNELRKHKVSDVCIGSALKSIDHDEYEAIIKKVLEKKLKLIKSTNDQKKFFSTLSYAVSRGFESNLVTEQLNKLKEENIF